MHDFDHLGFFFSAVAGSTKLLLLQSSCSIGVGGVWHLGEPGPKSTAETRFCSPHLLIQGGRRRVAQTLCRTCRSVAAVPHRNELALEYMMAAGTARGGIVLLETRLSRFSCD